MSQVSGFTQLSYPYVIYLVIKVTGSSKSEPRSMKWEQNGELAQRDLSDLVNRLLDVESQSNSNELSRLGTKYDKQD